MIVYLCAHAIQTVSAVVISQYSPSNESQSSSWLRNPAHDYWLLRSTGGDFMVR